MSASKNSIWYYFSMLPIIVALTSIILLTLVFFLDLIDDRTLLIIFAFALAELNMVLAGLGGISYLIDNNKTSASLRLMKVNIALFFLTAFTGLLLFLQL